MDLNILTVCANVPSLTTNRFRAEFVQNLSGSFAGPRVVELDAFSTPKGIRVGSETLDGAAPEGSLYAPYPNPTSGNVALPYETSRPGHVKLAVYDVLGREVKVLFDGLRAAGRHEAIVNVDTLPSALYFVQLTTPDGSRHTRGLSVVR